MMKKYQRKRTLDELRAECQKRNWPMDETRLEGGSDFVSVKFNLGKRSGQVCFSVVNGSFFGTTQSGRKFSSLDGLDKEKWFQELLDVAFTNDCAADKPPVAQAKPEPEQQYRFTVTTRYYGAADIARCNGFTASSTNSPQVAAEAAAQKAWIALWRTLGRPMEPYIRSLKSLGPNLFEVTFTKKI